MKQRMSSVDVAAAVACLNKKLLGMRVANVYDSNAKTYILKLARSGEDGEKAFLLLESGARFHTTELLRSKSDVPSNFTLKLRKHIRTRRLECVRQLGVDRIVDFVFGSGEATYHLILEMYSQGNVILTDSKYEVLTLLRSHRDDEGGYAVMARHPYPMDSVRLRKDVEEAELASALTAASDQSLTLKGALASFLPYGPAIAEHVILSAGLSPSTVLAPGGSSVAGVLSALMPAVRSLEAWFVSLEDGPPPGYITLGTPGGKGGKQAKSTAKGGAGGGAAAAVETPEVYQDFNPIRLRQSVDAKVTEFPTYDAALDEFFSKIEGQRSAVARSEAERSALGKLDRIRLDQSGRVSQLQRDADEAELRGSLIEYNLDAVDAAIDAVNTSLAAGMDWRELDRMIRDERKAGNPVAALIHSLQLESNRVTLLLSNYLDDEEGEDEAAMTRPASKVQVDLGLSAHANASTHFQSRKKHAAKKDKTLSANEVALRAAERKAQAQLQQVRAQPQAPSVVRKPAWFERFHWFISSENYLVISGRDAQQNELIVKRYFRRGDVYVHAELHGASSTIIKNPDAESAVPPATLQQAGCACVCRSRAWDSKIVTSAWWVYHHQVSKTAPSGEYLPTGSFMVRGRKNFLPPQPLVFGFGFMFKLEEGSIARHLGERAPRVLDGDGDAALPPGGDGDDDADDAASSAGSEQTSATAAHNGGHAQTSAPSDGGSDALAAFMEGGADPLAATRRGSNAASVLTAASSSTVGGPGGDRGGGGGGARTSFDRYGLDASPAMGGDGNADGDWANNTGGGGGGGRVRTRELTAKEREALKAKARAERLAAASAGDAGGGSSGTATSGAAPSAPTRGKKGKAAKMRSKYADQDEEERAMALALLASQGDKKTKADRRKERKERKEAKRQGSHQLRAPGGLDAQQMQDAVAAATRQFAACVDGDDDGCSDGGSASGSEAGGDAPVITNGHAAAQGSGSDHDHDDASVVIPAMAPDAAGEGGVNDAERKEIAALLADENGGELTLGDEDKERLTVLDSMTGMPRPEDLLLAAIPVCGPYATLQSYKYKVKLTPGTVKKGKAVRQITELLIKGGDVSARERELVKGCPEMDAINAMVGQVKISMPGLQKLKAAEKSGRKARAQAKKASGGS